MAVNEIVNILKNRASPAENPVTFLSCTNDDDAVEWMKDDLDALDESIPFTKFTLDNLLGIVSNEESYQHYFNKFVEAQNQRQIMIDDRTGQPSQIDALRKNTQWNYNDFRSTNGPAKMIPHVQQFKQQIATMQ